MKTALTLLAAVLLGGAAFAAEPGFAVKPKVEKTGETVKITFTVSTTTDVAVSILDAKGKVVRHLAAGVLGKNAPAPLKADSLSQSIAWDVRDDAGKPVQGGPFKVKVALGLTARFDRLLGYKPTTLGRVAGLAVGKGGELFVVNTIGHAHGGHDTTVCQVFDRQGKYLRTIMPYPASIFPEKVKGFGVLDLGEGGAYPFIHHAQNCTIYPLMRASPGQQPVVTPDGRLVMIAWGNRTGSYMHPGLVRLLAVNTADGSSPAGNVLGPVLLKGGSLAGGRLALAPDGETFYVSGLITGRKKRHHVVYRFKWTDEKPTPFVGVLYESGADETHLNDPRGVATDKDGNVYVADRGNNRIAVFKPDGSRLGELKVDRPEVVVVHPETGALYVIGGPKVNALQKFSSWKELQPVAKAALPYFKHRAYTVTLALDAAAKQPILWLGSPAGRYARFNILRIEDKGRAFGDPVEIVPRGTTGVGGGMDLTIDRARDEIYVQTSKYSRHVRIDGRTGKETRLTVTVQPKHWPEGNIITVAPDGLIYCYATAARGGGRIARFDRSLKQIPFPGGLQNIPVEKPGMHQHAKGITVSRTGEMYVVTEPGGSHLCRSVAVYGPDGTLKRRPLLALSEGACSVRVDNAGNMYVAEIVKPGKTNFPKTFQGKMPETPTLPEGGPGYPGWTNWYPILYGSIVKFGPEGGAVWHPKEGMREIEHKPPQKYVNGLASGPTTGGEEANMPFGRAARIKGAIWMYPGLSPLTCPNSGIVQGLRMKGCGCGQPRFDLDGFARIFVPDAGRFRVVVLDTNANEILTFGSYGNQDSAGPRSAIPAPAIAFAWPQMVAASDEAVYVTDAVNRRIVRVKLTYAAEEICPIP